MRRLSLVVLGVTAVVAAACSSGSPTAGPDPTSPALTTTSTTEAVAPTTTAPPTTTSTTLRPTTTSSTLLALGPGEASIVGTVTGPSGPVDGATVRVERLVGRNVASQDVTTTGGGTYALAGILGGSYRVRALKPPDFASSPVEAFFLAANDRKVLDLKVPPAGGERITATVNPNPPRVDQAATITIQVGTGRVDEQGRPAVTPRPGVPLSLTPAAGIVLEGSPQALTDGNGSATWQIRCQAQGADTFQLTVGTGVTQVKIPACAAGASPPAPATTRAP
ncbi:MAG TPA: carboxypeptidase-like regulatory domain-containing protein [Acidimicrobiales bacterium]|nr:carboxypeptidase-like regulatory domain-containing protein [Acidimicrobiales bacterium]